MNFLLHAFNPEAKRRALHDAAKPVGPRRLSTRRNDPTGTLDIREAFWRDLQGRWGRVSSQVTNTVRSGAALPLGPGNSPAGLVVASERVASFRRWLEETIASWVIGHEASWASQYLFQASARASSRAGGATDGSAPLRTPSADLLPVWFASELKGICDATVQQIIRSVTEAILGRQSPTRAGMAVKEVIRSIGVTRSKGLVEYAITSAVSHATLDALEARGVTHVGTIPETLPHAHTHVGDAAKRPLYVARTVLNGAEIVAWAKAAGFKTTLPADDMHVTVCFSRTPLDWSKVQPLTGNVLVKGGERALHQFGDGDGRARTPSATVLTIESGALAAGHQRFRDAGASWDHPSYQPHVTLTWDVGDFDWKSVKPYAGEIALGPEIFKPIKEDWKSSVVEDAARATAQHKHPRTGKFVTKAVAQREVRRQASTGRFKPHRKPATAREQGGAEEAAARLNPVGEVEILTAEDDRVCPVCLRISENGPYPINRARSLLPAHLNCRCLLVEAGSEVLHDQSMTTA